MIVKNVHGRNKAESAARAIQLAFKKVNFKDPNDESGYKKIVDLDPVLQKAAFVALPMFYRAVAVQNFGEHGGGYELGVIPRSRDLVGFKGDGGEASLLEKLLIERTEEGIIQACALLICSTTWMPLYWHAGDAERTFFFTQAQFDRFVAKNKNGFGRKIVKDADSTASASPLAGLFKEHDLAPHASFSEGLAQARFAMWNDWGGLEVWKPRFRLTSSGYIDNDSYDFEIETLYEYNCGVVF